MKNNIEISNKSSNIQLAFLGFVSLLIGLICMFSTGFIYGFDPLTSISESATTGNTAGMILPFALGYVYIRDSLCGLLPFGTNHNPYYGSEFFNRRNADL